MSLNKKTVIVLGNGFTKAFIPDMPLVKEGFDIKPLLKKYSSKTHPESYAILNGAINFKADNGECKVSDFEILMTRLDNLMPYDFRRKVTQELEFLYHDLKIVFVKQIRDAISNGLKNTSGKLPDLILAFADYCISNQVECVTFNYDDFLDQALFESGGLAKRITGQPYWYPDGGYGFYCRPAHSLVLDQNAYMDVTSMFLLKLHGSINWRIKMGASEILGPEDLVHKGGWLKPPSEFTIRRNEQVMDDLIENHLKPEGLMVLPVLLKGDLKTQPIFRLIWGLAYEKLAQADEVLFVGYSLPPADIAARFLFKETLSHKPNISVINYAGQAKGKNAIKNAYREVFPWLPDKCFNFTGAKAWCENFIEVQV